MMNTFRHLLFIFLSCFFISISIKAEEIKHKDFTIVYDAPELKYYATVIKEYLISSMAQLEIISGLSFKKKILVNIYKNTDMLLYQNRIQKSEDIFYRIDSASSLGIIITPPIGYYSNLPFPLFLQKKLFYVLFRQNQILENVWFEEAFFEIVVQESNNFGLISMAEIKQYLPYNSAKLDSKSKSWETISDLQNTPENIKLALEKINFSKTMLLFQRHDFFDKDPIKIAKFTKFYIKNLKKNIPWLEKLNTVPNVEFIKNLTKRRALFSKMMENFNAPGSSATQNITQDYIFRMVLRLLIKKETELAHKLFKEIKITPSTNPYFPELGLFFAKKYKTDLNIWLEYFLLNQINKKPIDFEIPDQVSNLLFESLSKEMPDFQVSEKELDFIRTIQFLLYLGRQDLILMFLEKFNESPQNIEIKNLIWGVGILINKKSIIKDYEKNTEFYQLRTWDEIKAIK